MKLRFTIIIGLMLISFSQVSFADEEKSCNIGENAMHKLEQELEQARVDIKDKENEIIITQNSISGAVMDLRITHNELAKKNEKLDKIKVSLNENNDLLEILQSKYDTLNEEYQAVITRVAELEAELALISELLQNVRGEYSILLDSLVANETELADQIKREKEYKDELSDTLISIENYKNRILFLEEKFKDDEGEKMRLNERISSLTRLIENREAFILSNNRKITALEISIKDSESSIDRLSKLVEDNKKEHSELSTKRATDFSFYDEKSKIIKIKKGELEALNNNLNAYKRDVENALKNLQGLVDENQLRKDELYGIYIRLAEIKTKNICSFKANEIDFMASTDINGMIQFSGYSWCDNVGWVKMSSNDKVGTRRTPNDQNSLEYGVYFDPNTQYLQGYGWNEDFGYIKFDESFFNVETGRDSLAFELTLQYEKSMLLKRIIELEELIGKFDIEIKNMEKKLNGFENVRSEALALSGRLQVELSGLINEIAPFKIEAEALNDRITKLSRSIEKNVRSISLYNGKIEQDTENLGILRRELESAMGSEEEQKNDLSQAKQDLIDLKRTMEAEKVEYQEKMNFRKFLIKKSDDLRLDIHASEIKQVSLNNTIAAQYIRKAELWAQILYEDGLLEELSSLRDNAQTLNNKLEELTESINEKLSNINSLQENKTEVENLIQSLENTKKELEDALAVLNLTLRNQNLELEILIETEKVVKLKIKELKEQMERMERMKKLNNKVNKNQGCEKYINGLPQKVEMSYLKQEGVYNEVIIDLCLPEIDNIRPAYQVQQNDDTFFAVNSDSTAVLLSKKNTSSRIINDKVSIILYSMDTNELLCDQFVDMKLSANPYAITTERNQRMMMDSLGKYPYTQTEDGITIDAAYLNKLYKDDNDKYYTIFPNLNGVKRELEIPDTLSNYINSKGELIKRNYTPDTINGNIKVIITAGVEERTKITETLNINVIIKQDPDAKTILQKKLAFEQQVNVLLNSLKTDINKFSDHGVELQMNHKMSVSDENGNKKIAKTIYVKIPHNFQKNLVSAEGDYEIFGQRLFPKPLRVRDAINKIEVTYRLYESSDSNNPLAGYINSEGQLTSVNDDYRTRSGLLLIEFKMGDHMRIKLVKVVIDPDPVRVYNYFSFNNVKPEVEANFLSTEDKNEYKDVMFNKQNFEEYSQRERKIMIILLEDEEFLETLTPTNQSNANKVIFTIKNTQ